MFDDDDDKWIGILNWDACNAVYSAEEVEYRVSTWN